ncbi:MAG: sensor histidine kinase [Parasulfuritortus sp.]|jgi:signal transduction histidine kinase|nr:sensor histidine kinase [Parasulfuritortus sp.]
MEDNDLYAALLHEMKNNLVLLAMTLDNIPHCGEELHDAPLDAARLLAQRTSERLLQSLLIYKNSQGGVILNAVDAYSTEDFVQELAQHTRSLKGTLTVTAEVDDEVPAIWFFDRNMLEMAMINAVHNSISYARQQIHIRASIRDGMLAISVRDDSDGYPAHILEAVAEDRTLQTSGTGLGLRFARLIARAHQNEGKVGELRLYNENGAVFEIRVP